jgi:hypothetical protein
MAHITYRQLAELIKDLTDEQKDKPVQVYCGTDGELHPQIESRHPGYDFDVKFVPVTYIDGYAEPTDLPNDPDQYVLYPEMSEQGSLECKRLHMEEVLKKKHKDPSIQQSRENHLKRINEQLNYKLSEYPDTID